ncbi:hypothetical protein JZ751_005411 [Albula glossodonta]|uniref:Dedicator of cytokinesis N-terminal domain-containing protein n=1 Tax=Albula glossodonta TaxID=121402 RepID=A0A8T2N5U3_9TELE|nr:hypothetical protein JZ751_005411 [Albula glossodonta]
MKNSLVTLLANETRILKHKVDLFYKLRHVMNELIDLRRQMLSGHLTQDQIRDVKRHVTIRLDWGNEHLGLDLVPRKEFEMHLSSRHTVQQSTSQDHCPAHVANSVLANTTAWPMGVAGKLAQISQHSESVAERLAKFMVRLNKNGGPKNPEKVDRLCALFTDLSNKDMKRELYVVSHGSSDGAGRGGRPVRSPASRGSPHTYINS